MWEKKTETVLWKLADLQFVRSGTKTKWIIKDKVPKSWNISFGENTFSIRPTSFKHTGLFPEQFPNWQWMEELIKVTSSSDNFSGPRTRGTGAVPDHSKLSDDSVPNKISVLNLFAYTGGATLACAKAGAEVCHVDASKNAVEWARENAKLSGLENLPIRWIVEDAIIFMKREIKRGRKYDAIIMDPPSFGHGPKDELWKIEENFLELMRLCRELLSERPLFVLINGYTAGYSAIVYENNLKDLMKDFDGHVESGELAIEESDNGRLLPSGIFARWERK